VELPQVYPLVVVEEHLPQEPTTRQMAVTAQHLAFPAHP
jgi:hypothetical protein